MVNLLFLIPAFILGYIACYVFMTWGLDQDGVWISIEGPENDA
jgi:hypothetical protein